MAIYFGRYIQCYKVEKLKVALAKNLFTHEAESTGRSRLY